MVNCICLLYAVSNSSLDERDCSTVHEVAGLANGFSPVPRYPNVSSLPTLELSKFGIMVDFLFLHGSSSGELVVDNKIVEENNSSGHDHEAKGPPVEERCELLSEASMEVPNVVEYTDKVPSEGNDIGKILPEENGATASKEKTDGGKVNNVEKPSLQSSAAVGKSGATAYLRRGKRRN